MLTISGLLRRLSAVVKAALAAVVPEEEEGGCSAGTYSEIVFGGGELVIVVPVRIVSLELQFGPNYFFRITIWSRLMCDLLAMLACLMWFLISLRARLSPIISFHLVETK
jgi:hypothetical protein